MTKINKKMTMGEILERHPQLGSILMEEYDLRCGGCPMGQMERLAEGAGSHGMNDKQVEEMVKRLNEEIEKLEK